MEVLELRAALRKSRQREQSALVRLAEMEARDG
jgi:hypothetical protein